jgi:hypothetical protein
VTIYETDEHRNPTPCSTVPGGDESSALKLNSVGDFLEILTEVGSSQVEKNVLAMYWLWNDGSPERSVIQLAQFRVQRTGAEAFSAVM